MICQKVHVRLQQQINPRVYIGTVSLTTGDRFEVEMRENKEYGKSTYHYVDGTAENRVYKDGERKSEKNITDKDESFYLSGVPHKALTFGL